MNFIIQPWINAQNIPVNYIQTAQDFLTDIKNNKEVDHYIKTFEYAKLENLSHQVETDNQKFAFWINIYNAYIQVILAKTPERYKDRRVFFSEKQINIGGHLFSFADIEHGILRHSQHPFFLGYVTRPFPDVTEKKLRVEKRNYRIHFALNCGAKSCPPVAVFDVDRIEEQLNISTEKYLKETTRYVKSENTVYVTSLFSWFRGDFDGIIGIKDILRKFNHIDSNNVNVKTTNYDWTLQLNNFIDI
ncbi:MAG: DUF547 domain-containing protein [Saprospiraceae bacterium]|nr:DUF547 domain-containing protein [Saprospiraceae bacterium]